MRKILFYFFCVIALNINAQDVQSYYKKINEGKRFVIEKKLPSALNSYYSAFENYDYPFARDCYNAIEL